MGEKTGEPISGEERIQSYFEALGLSEKQRADLHGDMQTLLEEDNQSIETADETYINWAFYTSLHKRVQEGSRKSTRAIFKKSSFFKQRMVMSFYHMPVDEETAEGKRQNADYYMIMFNNVNAGKIGDLTFKSVKKNEFHRISGDAMENIAKTLSPRFLGTILNAIDTGNFSETDNIPGSIETYSN